MNDLIQAAKHLQTVLQSERHRFCFIGGMAVQRWGEPRVTRDVDVTVFVGFGNEMPAIDLMLEHYQARLDNAAAFARENRIMLLRDGDTGVGIDVSLGALDFEDRAIDRATFCLFDAAAPGTELLTCSAEDLIVFKAFANRDIDWHDIKTILIRQQGKLDFDLVRHELAPLAALKEEPQILDRFDALTKHRP